MPIQRHRLATTALSAALLVSNTGWAGEGFITQPKLRQKQSAQIATPVQQDAITPQRFTGSTSVQPVEKPQTFSATPKNSSEKLRWVTRGSTPLHLSTPEPGVTSPPAAPVERVRTQTAPSVQTNAPSSDARQESSMPRVVQPTISALVVKPAKTEDAIKREKLASLVSNQIISRQTASRPALADQVRPIESPPGWQAIGERLAKHVANCEALLRKNAFYSARAEIEEAVLHFARVQDLMSNGYHCEPAWQAAQQALLESQDFSITQRLASDQELMRRIIDSHETTVLKQVDVSKLAPMTAAQHYRQFAQQKLLEASNYHPWAGDLFYAIGRTHQAQADNGEPDAETNRITAVTYYRSALALSPQNSLSANQLGYILLQLDQPLDAREALLTSLNTAPSAAGLQNLVEASRRLGDSRTMQWASQNLIALQAQAPPVSQTPAITEVDPQSFAALSPYEGSPQPVTVAGVPSANTNRY